MQHKNFCRAKRGNAAMNAGWRTSLKTFLSTHFFKDILVLSSQILIYSHDASINCAIKQEVIILFLTPCTAQWFRFLHPLLCNEESVVQKNFPEKDKKMLWVRVKKAGNTSFSAPPKAPRFSRRRERETRVTREWLVTKRKGAWEKRGAKSRPFSPSRPTSFPGFRPTRPLEREGDRQERTLGTRLLPTSFVRKFSSILVPRASYFLSRRGLRIPEHEGLRTSWFSCSDLAG